MQPPSTSSRSRTRTLQPPRARSAAQTSELIPLPTTTASVIDQVAELVVADEPAFPRPELLHLREHFGAPLLGNVEPELLRFDPDRVEAALLAEHDPPLGVHELRGVRLDRRRVVELARDGATFAAEERLAGDGLPWLELVAGELAHALGDLAHLLQAQVRLDPVERAQRQRDLAQVRVAGALAHPVDRPVHPARSRPHRSDGGGRREAEVVVAVEVHG